jgi:hypothetical protein
MSLVNPGFYHEVLDNGPGPGLHVFIVGVSDYPYLKDGRESYGMEPLSSPCLSAYRLYEWLHEHKRGNARHGNVPLATCFLLLAPSDEETRIEPEIKELAKGCTLEQFQDAATAWRRASASSPENMTLFYFAGHGIGTSRHDSILLMQDFNEGHGGIAGKGINFGNIRDCMAPTPEWRTIARTQIYFVDACRNWPREFHEFEEVRPSVWCTAKKALAHHDCKCPVLFSASPDEPSYGLRGEGTFLGKALIECLDGAAAEAADDELERWEVSLSKLVEVLHRKLANLSAAMRVDQKLIVDCYSGEKLVLHRFDEAPHLDVTIAVVPDEANNRTKVDLTACAGPALDPLPVPLDPHPYRCRLRPGEYLLAASVVSEAQPPYCEPLVTRYRLRPPGDEWKVTMRS